MLVKEATGRVIILYVRVTRSFARFGLWAQKTIVEWIFDGGVYPKPVNISVLGCNFIMEILPTSAYMYLLLWNILLVGQMIHLMMPFNNLLWISTGAHENSRFACVYQMISATFPKMITTAYTIWFEPDLKPLWPYLDDFITHLGNFVTA